MSNPVVSICLPNLNTRPFLEERMATILAQTVADWELIVCDSYSDDGSWEFFQKFKEDPRVRLYQVPRAGLYAGWNECLRRVRGRYVYIATSDDTCEPDLLEKLTQALDQRPDVDMATCNFTGIDEDGRPAQISPPNGAEIYGEWLTRNHRRHGPSEFVAACAAGQVWSTITSVLFRTTLLQHVGYFPEQKQSIADFEWGIRCPLFTDTIHLAQSLATWRVRSNQATRTLDWARYAYSYVDMIHDTLTKFHDRVPVALRNPVACRRLTWPIEVLAFDCLKLHPYFLLRQPLRTLRNIGFALSRHPKLTIRHITRGASWNSGITVNHKEYVDTLLRDCNLPPICTAL